MSTPRANATPTRPSLNGSIAVPATPTPASTGAAAVLGATSAPTTTASATDAAKEKQLMRKNVEQARQIRELQASFSALQVSPSAPAPGPRVLWSISGVFLSDTTTVGRASDRAKGASRHREGHSASEGEV